MSICLNMIVKNESAIIRSTLENLTSYVNFAYWVICDTGSTDGTQDIIKTFFQERKIPGELFQDEWKDFGHNRSLALQRAYESKKADYVLIFDADDAFRGNFKLPSKLELDKYSCKFGFGTDFTWYRPVILNNRIKWKYFGVLHEYVDCVEPNHQATGIYIDGDYYIEARTIGGDRNKDDKKYQKDAILLEKALETETNAGLKARYAFYCAQSFRDCGDFKNGIKYYLMRTTLGAFDEEIHVSYYNAGKMMIASNYPEEEIEKTFLDGWNCMKDRSECLHELSKYFRLKGNYTKGYVYAELGRKITYPKNRVLFLHRDIYDWRLLDETAVNAYYLGMDDKVMKYNQKILRERYDERIVNNMQFSIKNILNKIIQSPTRNISLSRVRNSGVTLVLNYQNDLDLLKMTLNSLFHFMKDIYKIERYIILVEAPKVKQLDELKRIFGFLEVISWKHKTHIIPNLKSSLTKNDKFIFYLDEGWVLLRNKNYLNKSLSVLNQNLDNGQFVFNKYNAETLQDYSKKIEGNRVQDLVSNDNRLKYFFTEKHKTLFTTPSLIKKEFLNCISDFNKPIDENNFLVVYQNQIDFLKTKKV